MNYILSRLGFCLCLLVFAQCAYYPSAGGKPKPSGSSSPNPTSPAGTTGSSAEVPDPDAIWKPDYQVVPLQLNPASPPLPIAASKVTFAADIPYAQFDKTTFDIWMPKANQPTPLVIYIHGGGFISGNKNRIYKESKRGALGPEEIKDLVERGIAVAVVGYRLLDDNDTDGVLKPLNDVKRSLQFMRYHAADLAIDPSKIVLAGSSAGAGAALWVALHDDMAQPGASDPVARMSTRVKAVAGNEIQSTYDLVKWTTDIFPDNRFSMQSLENPELAMRVRSFYGIDDIDMLNAPAIVKYRNAVDMLSMVSADDPPVWILNKKELNPPHSKLGDILHSPYHAKAMQNALKNAGIPREVFIPAEGTVPKPQDDMEVFLIEQLEPK